MAGESGYERKRREILEAALDILTSRGFEGTTLEAVADALGYTKQALYYYFKSKEELLGSLVLGSLREGAAQVEAICAKEASAASRLKDLVRVFLDDHFLRHRYFSITHMLKGFHEKMPEGPERSEVEALSARIPQAIIGMIGEGVAAGEFRNEDPKVLGGIVFAMLSGVIIHLDMPALACAGCDSLKASLDEIIVKGISL